MRNKDKKILNIDENRNKQDIDMDEFLMQCVARAILEDEAKACEEAYEQCDGYDFTENMDEKLQAIFDRHDAMEKKKNAANKAKRFAKVAAVIVLALGVFGTAGYFSTTEAFRAELLNLIFKTHDKYDEIVVDENNQQPVDENNAVSNSEDSDKFVLQLDYVPDGYELVYNDFDEGISYQNVKNQKQYINLYFSDVNDNQYMDNEYFSAERIYRNGYEIELRYDNTNCIAMWYDREQYFSLYAPYMDKKTFLKVIEGIRRAEEN